VPDEVLLELLTVEYTPYKKLALAVASDRVLWKLYLVPVPVVRAESTTTDPKLYV
jgi:hypothetical protein